MFCIRYFGANFFRFQNFFRFRNFSARQCPKLPLLPSRSRLRLLREGEPRATRRGILKKGERRKGKKARIDEILSLQNQLKRYATRIIAERKRHKEHPELYGPLPAGLAHWSFGYEKWFDECRKKLDRVLLKAVDDSIISNSDIKTYIMEKP